MTDKGKDNDNKVRIMIKIICMADKGNDNDNRVMIMII